MYLSYILPCYFRGVFSILVEKHFPTSVNRHIFKHCDDEERKRRRGEYWNFLRQEFCFFSTIQSKSVPIQMFISFQNGGKPIKHLAKRRKFDNGVEFMNSSMF